MYRRSSDPVALSRPEPDRLLFWDGFDREDGVLGNGWTDGAEFAPTTYAPLGIHAGSLNCAQPLAPTGPEKGEKGIGCCWRDLGTVDVEATIVVPPQIGHFREATPLLHVTPGSREHGIGAWLSTFHGKSHLGFLLVGTIGNPVETFEAVATGTFERDDRSHALTVRSSGGRITCAYDGISIALSSHPDGRTIPWVEVPAALRSSSGHGIALDTHLEADAASMAQPVVDEVWFAKV
jgi:hypothetical protein